MSTPTKDRIIETSAELFRRQGYSATGVKQIVTAAQAPFGSLYHFFPGGKEELGAAAVRASGAIYAQLIPAVFDPAPDVLTGVRNFFAVAAAHLEETDYEDACPIATVALEVSSISETMREACAEVFESWITLGAARFAAAGFDADTARELTVAMLAALEGAFVLARALRDTEPLHVAGELMAQRVSKTLDGAPAEPPPREASPAGSPAARSPAGSPAPSSPAHILPTAAPVRPRLRARWPDRGEERSRGPASP
ncbi:MAG TPA: TetR family transcriptional regulator [Solirubrobacteraceae bacterium]|nr:TetR family transcriptional regulator [Solirubrobacteraceae bacterium]